MQALLDTHTFLWWVLGEPALSRTARRFIANPANQIFVSAASAWEISTKYRLGKLPAAAQLVSRFPQIILDQGFVPLAITIVHSILAGAFEAPHRDPFDRMLAAQSLAEDMPLLSDDARIDQFGATRIW